MDEQEFLQEKERIKEDIDDFPWPYSPCEYFHGRERLFNEDQFSEVVEFFREYQQKRFERWPGRIPDGTDLEQER
jgi:hypothetical protein